MDLSRLFFGERSLSKVAAVYESEAAAQSAARQVTDLPDIEGRQVQMVRPFDPEWGRRLEPEGVGIWRTAVRAHVTCSIVGMSLAALGFVALWAAGVTAIVTTPVMSLVAMVMCGLMFGLMAGGLITIRPDHDAVVAPVREAVTNGRWSVVVHPSSRSQLAETVRTLGQTGVPIFQTL